MQRLTIANNVRSTLANGAATGDGTLTVSDATGVFQNPPIPTAGFPGLVTLIDNLTTPTKIEVVTYTGVTNNGNGTRTLTGCTRAREGTTAQTWGVGTLVICAPTRALIDPANVALTDQVSTFTALQNFRQQRLSGAGVQFYRLNPFSSTAFDILSNPVITVDLVGAGARPESLVDYQFTIPTLADWDVVRFVLVSYTAGAPGKTIRLFNSTYNGGFVFPFGATHFGGGTQIQEFTVLGNRVALLGASADIASDIFNLGGATEAD